MGAQKSQSGPIAWPILDTYGLTFYNVGIFGLPFHLLVKSWSTYCGAHFILANQNKNVPLIWFYPCILAMAIWALILRHFECDQWKVLLLPFLAAKRNRFSVRRRHALKLKAKHHGRNFKIQPINYDLFQARRPLARQAELLRTEVKME